MPIMPIIRLILNMGRVDSDTARLLLGRFINLAVIHKSTSALRREDFCDGGGQGSFAVVDVPDGADVHVGLGAREFRRGFSVAAGCAYS